MAAKHIILTKWILVWSLKDQAFISIRLKHNFNRWQWQKMPTVFPVPDYLIVTVPASTQEEAQALAIRAIEQWWKGVAT